LLVPSVGFLLYLSATGQNHFGISWELNALIALSGVVTVVPLLTFTLSLRKLPLLTISFIQFLSPTIQMVIAVTVLNERLTPDRVAAFVCIWAAVAVFVVDAAMQTRAIKKVRVQPSLGFQTPAIARPTPAKP